ncbi:MAG: ABC transporter permease [Deltaproteobacteria bacterium]|nr:ABC transporter permease [Deltaproteobacteria bacterium]
MTSVRHIVRYRTLIWMLAIRELKLRYRRSVLGFLWTLLNPLILMSVYALVFSVFMRVEMKNYVLFVFAGLLPWLWLSGSMLEGVNAIVGGGDLLKKVMVPAEVLPLTKVLSNFLNYLLSLPTLLIFMVALGAPLGPALLALPVLLAIEMVFIAGLVLGAAALNVRFRDIQHLVSNFMTLWFFLTPILYSSALVPERLRLLLVLNPMAGLIAAHQHLFLEAALPSVRQLAAAAGAAVVVFAAGSAILGHYRESFPEEV